MDSYKYTYTVSDNVETIPDPSENVLTQEQQFDYNICNLVPNPDGTIKRLVQFPEAPPSPDPTSTTKVLSKDITLNEANKTWVRIYLPRETLDSPTTNKLPLIVYVHGGGFVMLSAASEIIHDYCFQMANDFPAIVVSLDYRLAPEHRLPAAYDDAVEALHWVKTTDEEWLTKYGDYSKCFLMGASAGGNVAYHLGLRGATFVDDLQPLKIKGLILQQPFFGGVARSESEVRLANDVVLSIPVIDLMWNLSLPIGADHDHEYSNPTVGGGSQDLDQIKSLGWTVMVTGSEGDPLVSRQKEVAKLMKQKGIRVISHFGEGGCHGDFVTSPDKAKIMFEQIKNFIYELSTS
ncbi:hypothetical protein K2173_008724 [Erythroxylum novogranatense]|uniref:Alpha/beta hydrolase fold-3 domain-containing protein n=1 Tax=Erythroxylum novogranatense TaxID=1862640 RepID=A0AAV8SLV7_9ROSI|nr:hypothetical protein K2173_008724 [Erythroxylum novogranatense]